MYLIVCSMSVRNTDRSHLKGWVCDSGEIQHRDKRHDLERTIRIRNTLLTFAQFAYQGVEQ